MGGRRGGGGEENKEKMWIYLLQYPDCTKKNIYQTKKKTIKKRLKIDIEIYGK